MSRVLTDAAGRELVTPAGLVYTQGCAPPCCRPALCPWYYRYVPCPPPPTPHECGLSAAPAGAIYVGATLTCADGVPLCRRHTLPVIRWGGWCWRRENVNASGCARYIIPGTPNIPPPPPGLPDCPLPCDAIGPAGPTLTCVDECSDPLCAGPVYIFPVRCPGQAGGGETPKVFVCGYQIAPAFAAGIRCPSVNIGGVCYTWDWPNASSTLPAGYSQFPGVGTWLGGCCECAGGDCTQTLAVECPGLPAPYPARCCAHAIDGRSVLEWEQYEQRWTGSAYAWDRFRGSAQRAGGVVTGTVTRTTSAGQEETGSWSVPVSGPFAITNYSPGLSGVFGAASSLQPCGGALPGSCPAGTPRPAPRVSGNCWYFESAWDYACVGGNGPNSGFTRVSYRVEPNPGLCDDGCSTARPRPVVPGPASDPSALVLPCVDDLAMLDTPGGDGPGGDTRAPDPAVLDAIMRQAASMGKGCCGQ